MANPFDFGYVSEAQLAEASAAFDQDCSDRHEMGAQKYGEGTFLDKDTFRMAMDELVDCANYIRYCYIKLALMRATFGAGEVGKPLPGMEKLGKDAVFSPVAPKKEPKE
jgi:hypothetical protein